MSRMQQQPATARASTRAPGAPVFDREEMVRRPISAAERDKLVKEAASLNSRFGQSTSGRKYL
jgi:hypothetical protein